MNEFANNSVDAIASQNYQVANNSITDSCIVSSSELINEPAHLVIQYDDHINLESGEAPVHLDEEQLALQRGLPPTKNVLLHSCCAPCSGSMIKELVDLGIQVTILWYNPNIQPRQEYEIRKIENMKYAEKLGIPFVDLDYDVKEWYVRVAGMEYDPERGRRCTECFDMRMERTALYAFENGFHYFTTTNATSRWKDVKQV